MRKVDLRAWIATSVVAVACGAPLAARAYELAFTALVADGDLANWVCSDPHAFVARDGVVTSLPGNHANLYTRQQYRDFVLRFEFRLSPGANNGIGLRAPMVGDAAFEGMEVQILDDTHPKYAELEPYQYHGSLYGVVAADRAELMPTGEWNTQEIECIGDRLRVSVNGREVLDASIVASSLTETPDGREHPGLSRKQGHVALLGHGDRVDFRNIAIAEVRTGDTPLSAGASRSSADGERQDDGVLR